MNDLRQQLLGTWALLRAQLGGDQGGNASIRQMPPEAAARIEIEFSSSDDAPCVSAGDERCDNAGSYAVRFAGKVSDQGRFTLLTACADRSAPQQITLLSTAGTNAERTLPGILQLKGDRLRLCLALEGDAPPSQFARNEAATDAPYYLATYKRKASHPSPL